MCHAVTFISASFFSSLGKRLHKEVRPIFFKEDSKSAVWTQHAYILASIICTQLTLNYCVAPFMVLSGMDSIRIWRSLAWYGHIMCFGPMLFFWLGGSRVLRNAAKLTTRSAAQEGKSGGVVTDNDGNIEKIRSSKSTEMFSTLRRRGT